MSIKIMPISDLRRQISQVIDSLRQESDVVYITQHGRPAAVLLDYAQYQSLLEHLQALAHSKGAPLVRETGEKYQGEQQAGLLDSLAAMAEDLDIDDEAEQYYLYGTESGGKPTAAIIPYDEFRAYLQYKEARARRFAQLREAAAANAAHNTLTEAEAEALVEQERQALYEEQRSGK